MNENINFTPTTDSRALYVVLSGISGGKDEPLVRYISDALQSRGSVAGVQFANDPLYHNDALAEMDETTFDDYFARIDKALEIAGGEEAYTNIVFVAHSFSSVIVAYYLGLHRFPAHSPSAHYTLITIDSDSSPEALKYLDSLSEKDFKDTSMNPFHQSIIDYMREHNSAEILKTLSITTANIDASEVGADHEFTNDESKRLLVEKILLKLPAV